MIKEIIDAWKNFFVGCYEMFFVPPQEWKIKPITFRQFMLITLSLLLIGGILVSAAWGLVFFLLSQL